ncbi:pilus assembly protein [Brevundimonas diminuta]|uniref:TadE/TadG family type IV pilus assembly protein n=1 Tax=Brevundimonas diminuta TaxID=293 RepID=UPI0022B072DD|nr:TadE family protein [Brevundimonas diminuta]MCZ4107037.1 pilus assembly protein [Brevundimonas diminuta]
MKGRPSSLLRDARGVTAVEFALVAPVLLLMLMGFLDLSYNLWARTVLYGEVQKAARDSSLESGPGAQAELDRKVTAGVRTVVPRATVTIERRNYDSFARVGKPEDFTDKNGNGRRDPGECYTDSNGNSQWDADRGMGGQGGADDVTRYRVTIEYPRLFFPLARMIGLSQTQSAAAETILRNQPYTGQGARPSTVRCA